MIIFLWFKNIVVTGQVPSIYCYLALQRIFQDKITHDLSKHVYAHASHF